MLISKTQKRYEEEMSTICALIYMNFQKEELYKTLPKSKNVDEAYTIAKHRRDIKDCEEYLKSKNISVQRVYRVFRAYKHAFRRDDIKARKAKSQFDNLSLIIMEKYQQELKKRHEKKLPLVMCPKILKCPNPKFEEYLINLRLHRRSLQMKWANKKKTAHQFRKAMEYNFMRASDIERSRGFEKFIQNQIILMKNDERNGLTKEQIQTKYNLRR